jgi:transcriptional regulator with PAS, ATPase and Fis domain
MREAKLAGRNGRTFLLQGESGTGKDFLARWIHDNSQWSAGPFFSVNCAALSPELAESELFGHEAGSFTGAARRKRGMLELAQGGTLLLNEIGEMPLPLQAKLLVFLDTKKFVRVGGEKEVSVDAAIIAASHRHLRQEVQDGRFLEALYYRLAVLTLDIPPLRQRPEDIPILVENLLSVISKHLGIKHHFVVSPEDMDKMKRYSWPGNVRELRNLLERSMMLWAGGPFCLEIPSTDGKSQEKTREHARHELPDQLLTCTLHEATDHIRTILCAQALHQHDGNKVRAARALGISRDALYRYIKKFDLGES